MTLLGEMPRFVIRLRSNLLEDRSTEMKSLDYRETLNAIGNETPRFEAPSDGFRNWLSSIPLDDETKDALLQNAIDGELSFANGYRGMFSPSEMMALCSNEPRFISERLLPIALAINGD